MKFWNLMGGRRNTMVWLAFLVASSCLYVTKAGKPIATFSEWTVFILPLIGMLIAGIVTGDKFDGEKQTEQLKDTAKVEVAKAEATVEIAKIEATK